MGKFDITKFAQTISPEQTGPRDIKEITNDILQRKQAMANDIVAIGQCLIEAKEQLDHGEWLPWLETQVYFSERSAQNYMMVAREFPNPQLVADLGVRKALKLLELPPAEREDFVEEKHVIDMTSRELEKAIRERDEARKIAESAKADAQTAEEARTKISADLAALQQIHEAASEEAEQARKELENVRAELQAMRDKPTEVAIETVVDQEAIDKARKDAIAEMANKVKAAEQAQKDAEAKRKSAEKALAEAKKQAEANAEFLSRAEKTEAELAEARRQLEAVEKAEKRAAIAADPDVAMFQVYFNQAQETVNNLRRLLLKARGREDQSTAEKLTRAIMALGDALKEAAK